MAMKKRHREEDTKEQDQDRKEGEDEEKKESCISSSFSSLSSFSGPAPLSFRPDIRSLNPLDSKYDGIRMAPPFVKADFPRAPTDYWHGQDSPDAYEYAYVRAVFENGMPSKYKHELERLVLVLFIASLPTFMHSSIHAFFWSLLVPPTYNV